MSRTKKEFYYDLKNPDDITVDDQTRKIVFMKRDADDPAQNLRYLELKLYSAPENVVIGYQDLLDRTTGPSVNAVLQDDWDNDWLTCSLWTLNGNPISTLSDLVGWCAMTRCIANKAKRTLEQYKANWKTCLVNAVDLAAEQLRDAPTNSYHVLSRFYIPAKGTTFTLGFLPNENCEITDEDIAAAKAGSKRDLGVDPVILAFPTEAEVVKQGWVKFSSSPLEMYTTWILQADKDRLEAAQTGNGKWERDPPHPGEVEIFDQQLLKYSDEFSEKFYGLSPEIKTQLALWRKGQVIRARRDTLSIMGESANQWAKEALGWTGTDSRGWLHRAAYSFEPPLKFKPRKKAKGTKRKRPAKQPKYISLADRFSNIIFGTRECNTDMIRAEIIVKHLRDSDKVHQMLVNTSSQCPPEYEWDRRYPRWLASKLEYEIIVQMLDSGRSRFAGVSVFLPFSRRLPFRFEHELDMVILDKYLALFDAPVPAAQDAKEDLLKQWELCDTDPEDEVSKSSDTDPGPNFDPDPNSDHEARGGQSNDPPPDGESFF
ncbi:betaine lipid synthase [Ceratobasidium sp. AG-Ba]|nr:betaine lipid synthase [Ceratobasidium sp. AG-Ba]